MIYKRYYIQVLLRVVFIVLTSLMLGYFYFQNNAGKLFLIFLLLLIFQGYALLKYLNRTNHYLSDFLLSLKEADGSMSINTAADFSPISDLHSYFREIREIINHVKIEKEKQFHYIRYIIENVGVGLISFDARGNIELSNQAARNLLRIPALYNIRDLSRVSQGMDRFICDLEPDKPLIYRLNHGDEILHLSVKASYFVIDNKKITLVSFQDIRNALEDKELESWQKLIRVLTHEIMNSITPINTLTNSLKRLLKNEETIKSSNEITGDLNEEIIAGLDLIDERGKGLVRFVKHYRSLTNLPNPHFKPVNISLVVRRILRLLADEMKKNNIKVIIKIDEELSVSADENLFEQVIINILKNALQALSGQQQPEIVIQGYNNKNGKIVLVIKDNGPGIPDDIINHIFIPFFTTKEGGSGIGLSLSRQIMRLHKGSVAVHSAVGKGTAFFVKF